MQAGHLLGLGRRGGLQQDRAGGDAGRVCNVEHGDRFEQGEDLVQRAHLFAATKFFSDARGVTPFEAHTWSRSGKTRPRRR